MSISNIFDFDLSLLFRIVAIIASYAIIIIQFDYM